MQPTHLPTGGADQPSAALEAERRPRVESERIRALIWLATGFLAPVAVVVPLHLPVQPSASLIAVPSELPLKAIQAGFVLLATWIVARLERRPLGDYGMPLRQAFGWRLWEGWVWGFAAASLVLLALGASGLFHIDAVALSGGAALRAAVGWGLVFLALAVYEECAFRGYMLFSFARRWRFWRAAAITSLLFGAAHLGNAGENPVGVVHAALTGLLCCLAIRRTGTLWFAVGYHAAWDWAETFFFGTPDSGLLGVGRLLDTSMRGPTWLTGGAAGPEGSVIAILALLVAMLLIHLRFSQAVYPDRPA